MSTASSDEERLPVAVLVPQIELDASAPRGALAAALTAIDELNRARSALPELPRIVAVACADDDLTALSTLSARLEVRLFIGPTRGTAVVPAADKLNGRGVLFAPFADAPNLATQTLTSSVVSCSPNRRDSYGAVLAAVDFLRGPEARLSHPVVGPAALILSTDEVELGFGKPFSAQAFDETVVHGGDANGLKDALDLQPRWPGLVVAASTESDWSANIQAIESESVALGHDPPNYDYLLLDQQASVRSLLGMVQGGTLNERLFDLVFRADPPNTELDSAFYAAFNQETGSLPNSSVAKDPHAGPDLNRVYDCTYLAVYAALAAQARFAFTFDELSPTALLVGLRALVGNRKAPSTGSTIMNQNSALPVDAQPYGTGENGIVSVFSALQNGRGADSTVDLNGASGTLDLPVFSATAEQIIAQPSAQYLSPSPANEDLYYSCKDGVFHLSGATFSADGSLLSQGSCRCP